MNKKNVNTLSDQKRSFYYYSLLDKNPKYLDYVHSELDKHVYFYGNHFKASYESGITFSFWFQALLETVLFVVNKFKYFSKTTPGRTVLSNCYFGFKTKLAQEGFHCCSVPWESKLLPSVCTFSEFFLIQSFKIKLRRSSFNQLISDSFFADIAVIESTLESVFERAKVHAIFLSNDVGFFERIAIDVAKKAGIKTFILMHGAAPRYINTTMDNRTDYLLVFGRLFVEHYIRSGIKADKIINVGHPSFSQKVESINKSLRFELEDILILSKTIPGQPLQIVDGVEGREGDNMRLSDRGNSILYLILLQQSLKKFGVRKVRLRIHPSESTEWYKKYIDTDFFTFDKASGQESMQKSSLVIGPTSSTFFDAIFYGVNYLIFEPLYEDGLDVLNKGIGYPFDGSEERIPAANTVAQLEQILAGKKMVDLSIVPEFINPVFSLQEVSELLA